jgi:hypothetical protein
LLITEKSTGYLFFIPKAITIAKAAMRRGVFKKTLLAKNKGSLGMKNK